MPFIDAVKDFFSTPMLALALAMVAGVSAQAIAQRARIPGLVLLLFVGILLGPDLLGLLQPQALGTGLHAIVGFGVAVILFEGGMNQDMGKLRKAASPIRMLVTVGALITAAGGALCAHYFLDWSWRISVLFGTLVIVTGPTVITPLLRRIKVTSKVETVLEAEGIFIDAVGAIIAVTALELALEPGLGSFGTAIVNIVGRLLLGSVVGLATGYAIVLALRSRLVAEGLENIFALSVVILTFELSNALYAESGIAAAIACGMAVGHSRMRVLGQLMHFKEQLTVLVVAVLFVLLAADVRLEEVQALGIGGILTVLVLMFVVRPINIFVCTRQSDFTFRERVFLSWIAPRGIVAAAMASFFAYQLADRGIAGGNEIRALVFMVIATTVTLQGLSGQWAADALGVSRPKKEGIAIIGANALARRIAQLLQIRGVSVTLIDSNARLARKAEREGFRVITGNALEQNTLQAARVDSSAGVLSITNSEKVNFLVSQLIAQEHSGPTLWLALGHEPEVTPEMLQTIEMDVFSAQRHDIDTWALRCRKAEVITESWVYQPAEDEPGKPEMESMPAEALLPVLVLVGEDVSLVGGHTVFAPGSVMDVLIVDNERDAARAWLIENSFREIEETSAQETAPSP